MPGATQTSYSALKGGTAGYINIGGWNTTITDVSTSAKETVGLIRREGANEYMYVGISTHTVTAQNWLVAATALTIGDDNYHCPIVLSSLVAGGTINIKLIKAYAPQALSANTYAWVMVRGIATVQLMTDTTTLGELAGIQPAPICHAKVQIATTTAIGYMLTAIACDVSGPAYFNLQGSCGI
jgi:hypothetical protein